MTARKLVASGHNARRHAEVFEVTEHALYGVSGVIQGQARSSSFRSGLPWLWMFARSPLASIHLLITSVS